MSIQIPSAFEKIFSDHPHRRARVTLLVVFVLLVVVGALAFFQNRNIPTKLVDPLQKEKAEALVELQQRLLTSPPISQAERDKALADLQQRLKSQNKPQNKQ